MSFALWVALAYVSFAAWFLTGLLIQHGLSYPKASTPEDYARTKEIGARGCRTGVFFHGLMWPLVIRGCKRDENEWGHYCRWVKYPNGHYSPDDLTKASLKMTHPETDWDEFYTRKRAR